MRSTFKIALILTILITNTVTTGCGKVMEQTGNSSSATIATKQAVDTNLSYAFDINPTTENIYSIDFKITNSSSDPATITFACPPANYLFEIYDENNNLVECKQIGTLSVMYEKQLAPGATYSVKAFEYKKDPNESYIIKNKFRFFVNNKSITKEITTQF